MNVIREINRINERELDLGLNGASWHDDYKDSAYIFAGGLPFELTEGDVITIFSQFGEIIDVNLPRDRETGKPRGFAFVMYEDQRSTVLAVDNMNGGKVLGRTVRVDHVKDYKQPGGKKEDGVFVPPEQPSMNAMPQLIGADDNDGESSDESVDSKDNEDPMAAYIKSERKSSSSKHASGSGKLKDKKRKHDGETKEERRARKAAKRVKKEGEGNRKVPDKGKGKVKEERDQYTDLAKQFGGGQGRHADRDERPCERTRDVKDRERSEPSRSSRHSERDGRDHDNPDRERPYDSRNRMERYHEPTDKRRDRDHDGDYDRRRERERRRDDDRDRRRETDR